jgi:hypothetical protein
MDIPLLDPGYGCRSRQPGEKTTQLSLQRMTDSIGADSGFRFAGLLFSFFQTLAAARLVKQAHDGEDRSRGDDHPFCPGNRPPENSQDDDSGGQQETAETKLHVSSFLYTQDS